VREEDRTDRLRLSKCVAVAFWRSRDNRVRVGLWFYVSRRRGLSRISLPCRSDYVSRFRGDECRSAMSLPCRRRTTFLRLATTTFWGKAASGGAEEASAWGCCVEDPAVDRFDDALAAPQILSKGGGRRHCVGSDSHAVAGSSAPPSSLMSRRPRRASAHEDRFRRGGHRRIEPATPVRSIGERGGLIRPPIGG
jgi:hypothetical protein